MKSYLKKKSVWGWALYDWANSAFSTTVLVAFLPILFKKYYCADMDPIESTEIWGFSNTISSVAVGLSAPILGAIADRGSYKKRLLIFFAMMGVVFTAALSLVAQGQWLLGATLFILANFGHAASISFCDSLLNSVSQDEDVHEISALGFSVGYLGGGVLFAVNLWMLAQPGFFGFEDKTEAIKASFVSVAVWWAVFSLPTILWVKEKRVQPALGVVESARSGWRQLRQTLGHLKQAKTLFLFLVAFFLYNDGVGTTIKMSIDFGLSIGLDASRLPLAILLVQFVAFPATLVFGKIARHFHPKVAIYICIAAYSGVVLWGSYMSTEREFFVLAGVIGCFQGGIQSISRSFYSRLIPPDKSGEFFGLYNLLGRFGGALGPAMMAYVGHWTGDSRVGLLTIVLLFALGALLLWPVSEEKSRLETENL